MSNVITYFKQLDVLIPIKTSEWEIIKAADRRISSRVSKEQTSVMNSWNCIRLWRWRAAYFLQKSGFHLQIWSSPCLTDEEMEPYNNRTTRYIFIWTFCSSKSCWFLSFFYFSITFIWLEQLYLLLLLWDDICITEYWKNWMIGFDD